MKNSKHIHEQKQYTQLLNLINIRAIANMVSIAKKRSFSVATVAKGEIYSCSTRKIVVLQLFCAFLDILAVMQHLTKFLSPSFHRFIHIVCIKNLTTKVIMNPLRKYFCLSCISSRHDYCKNFFKKFDLFCICSRCRVN